MSKYKTILFDLDNTLFDYDKSETYALQMSFHKNNMEFNQSYVDIFRKVNRYIWSEIKQFENIDDFYNERFRRFLVIINKNCELKNFKMAYEHYSEKAFLIEGALDVCKSIYKSCEMYIVTNGPYEIREKRLNSSQIGKYFKKIYSAEVLGCYKPSKSYFEYIMKDLNITNRHEVLIVGDSLDTDICGGDNVGIDTCFFRRKEVSESSNVIPTYTIESLYEIENILEC